MVEMKTLCGATFFVDEDVAEQHGHLAWRLDRDGYVSRKTTVAGKRGRSVRLHRVILGVTDRNIYVDHINMDKLDNTRANLRVATRAQNTQNRVKREGRLSEFKGVTKHGERWQAQINRRYIGLFDDEQEAAHAYNRAAIQLHGEFARLNPVGHPTSRSPA